MASRCFKLGAWRILGHDDGRADAKQFRGKRYCLGMIAGRKSQRTPRLLLICKPRQGIESAAKLERADALKILAFEEELRTGLAVDHGRCEDRRMVGMAFDLLCGRDHVIVSWKLVHHAPHYFSIGHKLNTSSRS